ncbi:MAG: DUF262 domain-containing protein [Kineosporiaceae bacterium]
MTAPLRTRPTAEAFPLDQLMEWAWTGRLRVPAFQRPLKWTRRDVVQLFDSIVRGFPIGSLLLWEREAPAETAVLGPLTVEAPAGQAVYVVDGQQRLTTLAAALHRDGVVDPRFRIGYDLNRQEFVPVAAGSDTLVVPVPVLYEGSRLLAWFRDRPDLADRFDAASRVSRSLRDLRIPAYVVRQDDEDTLREIFDRMNNAGKRLTRGEVFAALHRPRTGEVTLTPAWLAEQVQARTAFGVLDQGTAMQVVLARRGPDVTREIRNEFSPQARGRDEAVAAEDEAEAYARGLDAAVAAVGFLQNVAAVPHVALLPYQFLYIALVRLFGAGGRPTRREERLLRRFVWRAAVAGPVLARGNTSGVSRELNARIVPGDVAGSVQGLLTAATRDPHPYPPVDPFRTNSAASKTVLAALWAAGPLSPSTGEPVSATDLVEAIGEGGTARSVTPLLVPENRAPDARTTAGNRLLLVTSDDLETPPLELLEAADDEVLASHFLSRGDVEALAGAEQVQEVLTRRSERMTAEVGRFLDRMCEWEQEDTPDLGSLPDDDATEDPAEGTAPVHGPG